MSTRPRPLTRRAVLVFLAVVLLGQGALAYGMWAAARAGQGGWFLLALLCWGLLMLEIHAYYEWLWPGGIIRAWLNRRRGATP